MLGPRGRDRQTAQPGVCSAGNAPRKHGRFRPERVLTGTLLLRRRLPESLGPETAEPLGVASCAFTVTADGFAVPKVSESDQD